jgi:hypothetical protein
MTTADGFRRVVPHFRSDRSTSSTTNKLGATFLTQINVNQAIHQMHLTTLVGMIEDVVMVLSRLVLGESTARPARLQ